MQLKKRSNLQPNRCWPLTNSNLLGIFEPFYSSQRPAAVDHAVQRAALVLFDIDFASVRMTADLDQSGFHCGERKEN